MNCRQMDLPGKGLGQLQAGYLCVLVVVDSIDSVPFAAVGTAYGTSGSGDGFGMCVGVGTEVTEVPTLNPETSVRVVEF